MFKRVINIIKRDFVSSSREFILVYLLIAPILLAFIMSLLMPSVKHSTLSFVVESSVGQEYTDYLNRYGIVTEVADKSELESRLMKADETIGFEKIGEEVRVVIYGDEKDKSVERALMILNNYSRKPTFASYTVESFGGSDSPILLIGTVTFILMSLAISGGVIGLNLIEEKESKTIRAMFVSPVRKAEFVVGKCMTGATVAIVQILGIVLILGYGHVNFIHVVLFTLVNLSMLFMMGLLIGVFSSNQVMGLTYIKLFFLPVAMSIGGVILAPKTWHILLYWSPYYWSYIGYSNILNGTSSINQLMFTSGIILIEFMIIGLVMYKKMINGLIT